MEKYILYITLCSILSAFSLFKDNSTEEIARFEKGIDTCINRTLSNANQNKDSLIINDSKAINEELLNNIDSIDEQTKSLEKKIHNFLKIALIALILGFVSSILGICCFLSNRRNKFHNRVDDYVSHNKHRIKSILKDPSMTKTSGVISTKGNVTAKDIAIELLLDKKFLDDIASKIAKKNICSPIIEQQPIRSNVVIEQPSQTVTCKVELYARNSSTNILTDTSISHQVGKTMFKLILDNQDSRYAELDLSIDKDDVKGRFLRLDNSELESTCRVTRSSSNPESIIVLKKGKAQKNSNSEWEVIEKLDIELK